MEHGREQQSPGTIVEAVQSCVAYATASGERPFQHVAEFLGALQQSGWTASDLDRVKSLALAELVKLREDRLGGLPPADLP